MSIPERHMKQSKRIDNGETIVGGYYQMGTCAVIFTYGYEENGRHNSFIIGVGPSTVEDVAVKPIYDDSYGYRCPNCNAWFYQVSESQIKHGRYENTTPYCGDCGQRIDWQSC